MGILRTIPEAAEEIGVPKASLRDAAARYGLLVQMGRAVRINPDDYGELIRLCQDRPKAHDSTGVSKQKDGLRNGLSSTLAGSSAQQAQKTADMLKSLSRNISRKETDAEVVPLPQKKSQSEKS